MKRLLHRLQHDQTGDTIVEVLVTTAVISLVLVSAYVLTNRNTNSNQDAQERSQGVQLVQGQIETLRDHAAAGIMPAANSCYDQTGHNNVESGAPPHNPCILKYDGNVAGTNDQPQYTIDINCNAGLCTVHASWDSLISTTSKDTITMFYRPPA